MNELEKLKEAKDEWTDIRKAIVSLDKVKSALEEAEEELSAIQEILFITVGEEEYWKILVEEGRYERETSGEEGIKED